MKLFREIILIFGIYFIGEILAYVIPMPGNLLGMMLLLILLCVGLVKLDDIAMVSGFLLSHLSFFFIPAGVGLLTVMGLIESTWLSILIICLITTFLTMGVTGFFVQVMMKKKRR